MIFHLVLLATAAASPIPQGLTLEQFRQGARSLPGGDQEVKVQISPSYRKIRRHGRTQFIDTQDSIKNLASQQEVHPSARPVFVNTISAEDIEQKIREANKKELEKKLEEMEIKEEIEEAMEEAIDEAIEQVLIEEELGSGISDDSDIISSQLFPDKLEKEIDIIEQMIHENKMIQIVNDIINVDDAQATEVNGENVVTFETAPIIIEEKQKIKNIDGFNIGLNTLPAPSPVSKDIPLTSQILIIEDPIEKFTESVKEDIIEPVKKVPISSIDFGLIQEV